MARYIVRTSNTQAGGAANPAITTYFTSAPGVPLARQAAQLIAFHQYLLPAAGTQVDGVEHSVAPSGPTLPVPFPFVEYADLSGADANLVPMSGYSVAFGFNALTARGVGAVMAKRSAFPGRSGRGRLTTPWLPVSWVAASGELAAGGATIITDGWQAYLRDAGPVSRAPQVEDLAPYIQSPTGAHQILSVTVTSRLGRLRSRTE